MKKKALLILFVFLNIILLNRTVIAGVTYSGISEAFDTTSDNATPAGIHFNTDGTKVFVVGTNDIEDEVVKWIEVGRGPGFERIKGSRRQHVDTRMIDGTAVAIEDVKSPDAVNKGTRVFHQKFGYGMVLSVDGDKLDIDFEKAGRKKVMAGFVEAV